MADKVIKSNESIVPFFGERLSFIKGLDPLGLQNTSDATFSQLLPGLNNVTGRIRYYSFYCWLLDLYSKENGSTNPFEQKVFIRRAEFIIALASVYLEEDASSITGSNYAKKEIEVKGLTRHDLQAGTFKDDGATRETYWNYPTGAFGQYYLGSLRDIGIISDRDKHVGLYVRTNDRNDGAISGEALADAFDANILPEKKKLFLACIKNGVITEKQLKELLPDFDLTIVPENTTEHNLLVMLLIQKDYPLRIEESSSTLRRQTIKQLLAYLSKHNEEEFNDRIFVFDCYNKKGKENGVADECLMGWYYYQFNEFWHYANTSMLNGTLEYLENSVGPNWMPLPHLVEAITNGILDFFIKSGLITESKEAVNILLNNLSVHTVYECLENAADTDMIEKAANGILLMLVLYLENKEQLIELKEYGESKGIAKDGEGTGYFVNQFKSKAESSILKFVYDYVFVKIIYRHQYVAFRKIRGGIQSTQKFIIEDQHIRYLGNFDAGFTGPRIGRLISFLTDLNVITADYELSDFGKNQLKDLVDANN